MKANPWLPCLIIQLLMDGAWHKVKPDDFVGNWMTWRDGIVQLSSLRSVQMRLHGALRRGHLGHQCHPSQPEPPLVAAIKVFEAIKFDNGAWKLVGGLTPRSLEFLARPCASKTTTCVPFLCRQQVNSVTEVFTRVDEAPNDCGQRAPENNIGQGRGAIGMPAQFQFGSLEAVAAHFHTLREPSLWVPLHRQLGRCAVRRRVHHHGWRSASGYSARTDAHYALSLPCQDRRPHLAAPTHHDPQLYLPYENGRKLADIDVEAISDWLQRPDAFNVGGAA